MSRVQPSAAMVIVLITSPSSNEIRRGSATGFITLFAMVTLIEVGDPEVLADRSRLNDDGAGDFAPRPDPGRCEEVGVAGLLFVTIARRRAADLEKLFFEWSE